MADLSMFAAFVGADFLRLIISAGLEVLAWLAGGLIPLAIFCCLIYFDMSSALKRQERARCFVQLLETGAKQGRSFEQTVTSLSRTRDQTLGVYFHLVAAYVEKGHRLNQALEKVPYFLPPQINATLKAGEELGDIEKVLPACRRILADGASDSQVTQNNLMVVLFPFPGIAPVLICAFSIWVAPKIKDVAVDMLGAFPSWSEEMFRWSIWLAALSFFLWIAIWVGSCIHVGGPRFVRWLEAGLWPLSHRLNFWIPWRHKRMHRDFSVMLALLLDSGVPEEKAVQLAAHSTANRIFMARAQRVTRDLRQGINLTEALQRLDDSGEFRWRLRNAVQPKGSFLNALAGWHEALEAKAYQQEQAASQIITTSFVCLNGAMAALVAIGLFRILLAIVEEAPLW